MHATLALLLFVLAVQMPPGAWDWGLPMVVNGKDVRKTKWQPGYVQLRSGETLQGRIRVKVVNDRIKEVLLQQGKKKHEFDPASLDGFGLLVTMDDLTRGGKDSYRDDTRNFHPGRVTTNDGSRHEGFVAVAKEQHRAKSGTAVLFAETRAAMVRSFGPDEVWEAVQVIDGREKSWQAYQGGIIERPDEGDLASRDSRDPTVELHPGWVTLADGRRAIGRVAQEKKSGSPFSSAVSYVGGDGTTLRFGNELQGFGQEIDGQTREFFNYRGVYVELLHDGHAWSLFRNPFPTHERKAASGLATFFAQALADEVAEEAAEWEAKRAYKQARKSGADPLTAAARGAASGGEVLQGYQRPADISLMKKEWIAYERARNTAHVLFDGNVRDEIEPLLKGCGAYLRLDRSAQKRLTQTDGLVAAVALLDACSTR